MRQVFDSLELPISLDFRASGESSHHHLAKCMVVTVAMQCTLDAYALHVHPNP
jgi:hypothetical protein